MLPPSLHPRLRQMRLAVLALLAWSSATAAQTAETGLTSGAGSCSDCAIRLRLVATIGSPGDSVSPDYLSPVTRSRRGLYYVGIGSTFGKNRIAVYDSAGRLVRTVGRAGQGPGEFETITHIVVTASDTVHVIEASGRHSLLSPELVFIRTLASLPAGAATVIPITGGRLAASGTLNAPASVGKTVHV